jgi:hypothetical protein
VSAPLRGRGDQRGVRGGQATPNAVATSATARFDPAIAAANALRSRAVSRARGATATVVSVNGTRRHCASAHTRWRLRHQNNTCCPDAAGPCPAPPAGPSRARTVLRSPDRSSSLQCLDHDLNNSVIDTHHSDNTKAIQAKQQRRRVIHARDLAADSL